MKIWKLSENWNGEVGYFATTEELARKAAEKWYRVYLDDDGEIPSFDDFWTKHCFLEEIDVVTGDDE